MENTTEKKLDGEAWGLVQPVSNTLIAELGDRLASLAGCVEELAAARAGLDAAERTMPTANAAILRRLHDAAADVRGELDKRKAANTDFSHRFMEASDAVQRHFGCDFFVASQYVDGRVRLDQPCETGNQYAPTFTPEITDANRAFVASFSAPRRAVPDSAALAVADSSTAEIAAFVSARARYDAAVAALASAMAAFEATKATVSTAAKTEAESVRAAIENQTKRDAETASEK